MPTRSPVRVQETFPSTFLFNDTATTEIYTRKDTLSLHDALPISPSYSRASVRASATPSRRFSRTTVRSEEHTSELQSPFLNSYAVFCLKKKNSTDSRNPRHRSRGFRLFAVRRDRP